MVTFRVKIEADARNATAATNKVKKNLTGVATKANQARVSIGRMFTVLATISIVRRSIRAIADFEQAISTIEAVTQGSAAQMRDMIAVSRELGATTVFTATQAADGLVLLSRAGFTANESLQAIGDTLNLARAGGLGIARATEIAADTLRGFGIEAENTARVVDVLALASSKANTTVEQLGQALKFTAPIARGLGVSLEETNAALAALADAGQKASIGGTGLRRVMAALESPTAKARNTLRSLGLEARDVQISSVGLTKAMANLARAGVSTAEIFQIFGRRSGTAAQVLVANIPKIEAMRKALDEAGGTAKTMAEIMGQNMNDALFKVTSAFNELRLSIAEAGLSSVLTGTLRALALAFRVLADNGTLVLAGLAAFATVILTAVVPAVAALVVNMGLLNGVMLANPLVLAGAAIVGSVVALTSSLTKLSAVTNGTADGMGKINVELERLQRVNNVGRAIDRLNIAIENNGTATEKQAAELIKLNAAYDALNRTVEDHNKNQKDLEQFNKDQIPTVENMIKSLKRQGEALSLVTEDQKLQAKTEKELNRLRAGGDVIKTGDKEKLKAALQLFDLQKKEAKALKAIVGPQKTAAALQATLNRLKQQGRIDAEQYNAAIQNLSAELPSVRLSEEFNAQVEGLKMANDQMRLRLQFSGTQLAIQLELLRLGKGAKDLSAEQLAALFKEINANQLLTKQLKEQAALESAPVKRTQDDIDKLRKTSLLKEISLTTQLAQRKQDLIALSNDPANLQYYADIEAALASLDARALASSTSLEDGFTRAFQAIHAEAQDFASVAEASVNAVANSVSNTLAKALIDGAFTWKDFTKSILDDITRIITRLLVMQAISAALGGAGTSPGLPGVTSGEPLFRAAGGAVQPDRSFIVGENGPELFTPRGAGNIAPAGTTAGASSAAPQINMQVVNVDDPDMVPQSIADGSSDEAIINVISRNRDKLKGIL